MQTEAELIQLCMRLGEQAALKGNSPVGALIVLDSRIIAQAEEAATSKQDVSCHAEMEVLRLAVQVLKVNDLSPCTLYSSHEPCIMCAYAIRFYRISKVVFRTEADALGSISSGMPLLTTNDVPAHWSKPPVIVKAGS